MATETRRCEWCREIVAGQELCGCEAETEILKLRRALRPFAELASGELSWASVTYMLKDDPERQTFERPQAQRWFNRAAGILKDKP